MPKLMILLVFIISLNFLYASERETINIAFYTDAEEEWAGEIFSNGMSINAPQNSLSEHGYLIREKFKLDISGENPFLILRVIPERDNLVIICSDTFIYIYSTMNIDPCAPFNIGSEQFTAYISDHPINIEVFARLYDRTEMEIIENGERKLNAVYKEIRNDLSSSADEREIIASVYGWVKNNISYETRWGIDSTWESIESILNSSTADCKGMAIIIKSLLNMFNIDSKTVFSSTHRTDNKISKEILNGYNHVIVYIPSEGIFLDATNKNLLSGEVSDYTIGQKLYIIQDERFEYFRELNGMDYFYTQTTKIEESGGVLNFELLVKSFGKRILSIDLEPVVDQGLLEYYLSLFLEVPDNIITAKDYQYSEGDIRELRVKYSMDINDFQEFINNEGTLLTFQRFPSTDVSLSMAHGEITIKDCDPLVKADYFVVDRTGRYNSAGLVEQHQSIFSFEKNENIYGIHVPAHIPHKECIDHDYFKARHDAVADLYSIWRLSN